MSANGYFSNPSINRNIVIFTSDDDLWKIELNEDDAKHPTAIRLTNGRGRAHTPFISPNGKLIAFLSNETGQDQVYLMPTTGGEYKIITGTKHPRILDWKDDENLIISSVHQSFTYGHPLGFKYSLESEELSLIPWGPLTAYSENSNGEVLLGRHNGDPAMWKRYRGGRAGKAWIGNNQNGNYEQIFSNLKSNISCPKILENRILFISDHEGIGNIYSSNTSGKDIKRITHHEEFYVRNFSIHDDVITYQCGADLYLLNLSNNKSKKITFNFHSNFLQAQKRFENADDYFQEYEMSPDASQLALTIRGQVHLMPPWSAAPIMVGDENSRYKETCWVKTAEVDDEDIYKLLSFSQSPEHEETAVFIDDENFELEKLNLDFDWGKVLNVSPSPTKEMVAISNNRNQLVLLNTKSQRVIIIDDSNFGPLIDLNWSTDGRYLAYTKYIDASETKAIWIYDIKSKSNRQLIDPIGSDFSPCFDPEGNYLYFLSIREYHPTFSEAHADISFPFAVRPYALCLREDVLSPFEEHLDFEEDDEVEDEDQEDEKELDKKKRKSSKDKITEDENHFRIDYENANQRIIPFPIGLGGYDALKAIKNKVFYLKSDINSIDPLNHSNDDWPSLKTYCLKDKKESEYQSDVSSYIISPNQKFIFMNTEDGMRLCQTEHKPSEGEGLNKKDGFIDPERIKLSIDPRTEWKQMYQEAWVLQREHFWTEDMSRVDWENVYIKYLPLLEKINTRKEMSDLLWEMQGELGTSHCYEFGGDYNKKPTKHIKGMLGAEFEYHSKSNRFQITKIYRGNSWEKNQNSPLAAPGVNLNEGDSIYALDGRSFTHKNSLNQILQGRSNRKVSLTIKRKNSKEKEQIIVTPVACNTPIIYREWVKNNRDYIHNKSKGKIGYLHILDMSLLGYSEFYRQFLKENKREGLIIDVRYNGGGFVSQYLLKELSQKVIGFDQSRWMGASTYPFNAIRGPVNCITNETAGSDGDIFSHSFKLMKLGKLIGTRTWGGVIGIHPRNDLVDNSYTSQPEFSFWFKDVGYKVENYGTEPDIEVVITPDDYKNNFDPQLERAYQETMKDLKRSPVLKPNLKKRPNLRPPKLPH